MRLLSPICPRRLLICAASCAVISVAVLGAAPQSSKARTTGAPETFNARATVAAAEGRGDAYITIKVTQYTPEKELQALEKALQDGGSAAFVTALRRAKVVGTFEVGNKSVPIRWARQKVSPSGRIISIVTDAPVYFVGAGVPGAKSKEGFDVAVVQLDMDSSGLGTGKMAAAARVKPGGQTGVEIDAYEAEPVTLRSVMRIITATQ